MFIEQRLDQVEGRAQSAIESAKSALNSASAAHSRISHESAQRQNDVASLREDLSQVRGRTYSIGATLNRLLPTIGRAPFFLLRHWKVALSVALIVDGAILALLIAGYLGKGVA